MATEGQGKGLLIAGGVLLVLGVAGIGLALGLCISPASQVQDEMEALKSQMIKMEESQASQVQDEIEALKNQIIKMEESQVGADLTSGPSGLEQIVSSKSWRCPGGDINCRLFFARNVLTLDTDRGGTGSNANYWLAEDAAVEDQGFTMSLGHSTTVWGVTLRNTHNSYDRGRSTKRFRILGSANATGPWEELLVADLEDSRRQNPPPVQQLIFANPAVVSFIKFELLEYWGNGGGLQYFVPIYRKK